uniref:Calcium-independent phospholipase A2-gamma (inferred by orthology to a human protein) n=1 Tax=Strongyloides venezuelensis TaxID=75913 RepID=A0A0K0F2B5_STRVS
MFKFKYFSVFNKLKIKSLIKSVDNLKTSTLKKGKKLEGINIKQKTPNQTSINSSATSNKQNVNEKVIEEKGVEIVQPPYLGYLSGVLTSVIDQASGKIGETFSSFQQQSKKEDLMNAHKQDASSTNTSKVLIKRISRVEVSNLTKMYIEKLLLAQSTNSKISRIQELTSHIQEFRSSRIVAMKDQLLIEYLINLVNTRTDIKIREEARKCLSILGNSPPLKSLGIRILSIDGGGTKGMAGLTILGAIEKASGKRIYELYDHITGVSTGAILAVLLGINKISVEDCREKYMNISSLLFNQGTLSGYSGLVLSHSYYNSKLWADILKESVGDSMTCADSAKYEDIAKVGIVSCIVNSPQLQPYVFRNYELPPTRDSQYRGGSNYKIWQAVQASTAAPGYFEEVRLGSILHQDGGVLTNNPTAIAIHEAKNLWPNENIQCVVSIGNGRSVSEVELSTEDKKKTSILRKLSKIADSATDTQAIHLCINDLLPDGRYFRFDPYMNCQYPLNENQAEKLAQMQKDADLYVRRNIKKIEDCAKQLTLKPSLTQNLSNELVKRLKSMGILKNDFEKL